MTDLLFGKSENLSGGEGSGKRASRERAPVLGETTRYRLALVTALVVMVGIKATLLDAGAVPFNSDEAIVALMARHILAGERPVFFYGQAYMGSLDAYLVAFGFRFFGQEIWVVRALQIILYLGTLLTTVRIARVGFGLRRVGVLAAWLMAIPTVTTSLYTTVSLGGYGEALLIGNIILLLTLRIVKNPANRECIVLTRDWLALGFVCGLGFWANGLTLVYSVPALIYVFLRRQNSKTAPNTFPTTVPKLLPGTGRLAGLVACGFLVGASPWLFYAIRYGFDGLLGQLGGGMVADVQTGPFFLQILQHAFNLVVFGTSAVLGLRPSWEFRWLALPLIPLVLIFWGIVFVHTVKKIRSNEAKVIELLLGGTGLSLIAGFVFTPFGVDPSGRYFLPFSVLLALFASDYLSRLFDRDLRKGAACLVLILSFQLWGNATSALRNPPGLTTQIDATAQIDHRSDPALVEFLQKNDETRGYSNYWVAYPLSFISQEELIFTPRLPYHQDFRYTLRDDRYKPYDVQVSRSERVAYITTNHPDLDQQLREGFSSLSVLWKEAQIGDYHVFYALSRHVRPEELGLGMESQ